MTVGAVGRSYIEACRTPVKENAVTTMIEQKTGSNQIEARKWAMIAGSPDGTVATTVPFNYQEYCVKIGNNTPPSGFWSSVIDLIASLAPYAAAYFGFGAL